MCPKAKGLVSEGEAAFAAAAGKRSPDVIVTHANQTALFEAQNRQAAEWLHWRCGLTAENISGDTEIRVHPRECQRVIIELTAAGFLVVAEMEAP
jgi:hypothetical protein